MREVAHAQKRNPLSDLNKILQGGRYPRHNHLCKFWWWSVKGLGVAGGQSLPFSIDFDRRPYNTLALPCDFSEFGSLKKACTEIIRQWAYCKLKIL